MFGLVRIAGVSAALAAGLVINVEGTQPQAAAPVAGKKYTDRIAPSDPATRAGDTSARIAAVHTACEAQTWPYIANQCLSDAGATTARKPVRTITVERREAPATSTLVRVPVTTVASR